eukprot:Opistho-2@86211
MAQESDAAEMADVRHNSGAVSSAEYRRPSESRGDLCAFALGAHSGRDRIQFAKVRCSTSIHLRASESARIAIIACVIIASLSLVPQRVDSATFSPTASFNILQINQEGPAVFRLAASPDGKINVIGGCDSQQTCQLARLVLPGDVAKAPDAPSLVTLEAGLDDSFTLTEYDFVVDNDGNLAMVYVLDHNTDPPTNEARGFMVAYFSVAALDAAAASRTKLMFGSTTVLQACDQSANLRFLHVSQLFALGTRGNHLLVTGYCSPAFPVDPLVDRPYVAAVPLAQFASSSPPSSPLIVTADVSALTNIIAQLSDSIVANYEPAIDCALYNEATSSVVCGIIFSLSQPYLDPSVVVTLPLFFVTIIAGPADAEPPIVALSSAGSSSETAWTSTAVVYFQGADDAAGVRGTVMVAHIHENALVLRAFSSSGVVSPPAQVTSTSTPPASPALRCGVDGKTIFATALWSVTKGDSLWQGQLKATSFNVTGTPLSLPPLSEWKAMNANFYISDDPSTKKRPSHHLGRPIATATVN